MASSRDSHYFGESTRTLTTWMTSQTFLDFPDLVKLSLESIKSQLTVENIAFEVYKDLAGTLTKIRDVEMDYAVRD